MTIDRHRFDRQPQDFDALLPAENLGGRTLKGAQKRHQIQLLLSGQLVA
jgi:hypothetical protein